MAHYNFLKYQDKLYIVKRILKEDHKPKVEAWKELLGVDLVLRKEGLLYFVEEVQDLEIFTEETASVVN
jgi:hypothetical protein